MFTPGSTGLGAMVGGTAAGNPGPVAHSIAWNASVVDHHAVVTNSAFALIQILIGLGIAWRPALKPALAASVVWSLAVWWFGEGLGGVLHGTGTPVGGGPGAVFFYALLAVVLWPSERAGDQPPFVAARALGLPGARAVWAVLWLGLGTLALLGQGRSADGLSSLVHGLYRGEPGWLAAVDRHAQSLLAQRGLACAVLVALICVAVALGVFGPPVVARAVVVLAVVTAAAIWVVGENLGTILAGGATDPNSGPLLILLALCYWPPAPAGARAADRAARAPAVVEVG
jgi:hypothetical protein